MDSVGLSLTTGMIGQAMICSGVAFAVNGASDDDAKSVFGKEMHPLSANIIKNARNENVMRLMAWSSRKTFRLG